MQWTWIAAVAVATQAALSDASPRTLAVWAPGGAKPAAGQN